MTTKRGDTELGGPSAAPSRRRARAVESFGNAAEAIGPITHDMAVFCLTRGQWSMIDAVHHVVNEIGPAHVSLWSWTIAAYEVEVLGGLLQRGDLLSGRLVLDYSSGKRLLPVVDDWRAKFGDDSVRILRNHAKIARVWNDRFRVLIRGSMNLNFNPRCEQADITEGGPDFELVTRIEDALPFLPRDPDHAAVFAASGLGQAFSLEKLAMFAPLEGQKWHP